MFVCFSQEQERDSELGHQLMEAILSNDISKFKAIVFQSPETAQRLQKIVKERGSEPELRFLQTAFDCGCEEIIAFLLNTLYTDDIDLKMTEVMQLMPCECVVLAD